MVAATAEKGAADDGGLAHLTRLPARRARSVPMPDDVPDVLRERLAAAGVTTLWSHQAEARRRIREGEHVVIATGTASGKSLAYQLPAAERLLDDDRDVVLYLAPTKALARDQLRAVRSLAVPGLRAAALDGDTPYEERDAIRRSANWVLTNPDMLHRSVLGDHERWGVLLHRLSLVVIDEAHAARGVFGSHVGLVLRRLRRLAERYGAEPTFVLASATTGNPAEHAAALTGLEVTAVTEDGAPRGPLDLAVWLPPLSADTERRESTLQHTAALLASFVAAGVQTLAFAGSRRGAEVIALAARERLGSSADDDGTALADRVAAYRAGYLADDRRSLERGLRSGALRGVAATEALELGIDVAGLDAVLLAGWPGTSAKFWQRIGRAGRGAEAAVGVLIAAEDPLDHYLVRHPQDLTGRPTEQAIVDPDNPYLLAGHLRCACQEVPMDDAEAQRWFGPLAPDLLAEEVRARRLRRRGRRTAWTSRGSAAAGVNLRSAGGTSVRIVDTDTGAVIGEVDEARAHGSVHEGAVYLHQGVTYVVASLDLEAGIAAVGAVPAVGYTTRARSLTDVRVRRVRAERSGTGVALAFGDVSVTTQVDGYEVLRIGSGEVLDRRPLDLPEQSLETIAVWVTLEESALAATGLAARRVPGALHAAEHAAIGMLPLLALCDRWDLGGLSTANHPDTDAASVFIYDGVPGGAGLAEHSFTGFTEHASATRAAIATCACAHGCPSCVHSPKCGNGNEPLDKSGAIVVLDTVLEGLARHRSPGEPSAAER